MEEWLKTITGVRQGFVLSSLIFTLVADWVMTRVLNGKVTRIRWVNGGRLGDMNVADCIARLDNSWKGMKDPTDRTQKKRQRWGLTSTQKRHRS